MNIIRNIFTYLRHFSFIGFLYAVVVFYPIFDDILYGNFYLILFIVYIFSTFIAFFIKADNEENGILNNIVICILHFYFMFLAYSYTNVILYSITSFSNFDVNCLVIGISMFILTINKFLLFFSK